MLKGQDVIILVLLRLSPKREWNFDALSGLMGISRSQCHLAIRRLRKARLLLDASVSPWRVSVTNFNEYVIHALKYDFPAEIGPVMRGIPTAHSADFVAENFHSDSASRGPESHYVWPSAAGSHKGSSLEPLHPSQLRFVPKRQSLSRSSYASVYEILVCIDLLRMGQAREQKWAAEWIRTRVHAD